MKVGNLCIRCKGSRKLCGNDFCPILTERSLMRNIDPYSLHSISGSSPPSIFVGSYNYPNVSISPLVTNFTGDTAVYDLPESWMPMGYKQVIEMRTSLLRAKIGNRDVRKPDDSLITDLSIAKRSADVEIETKSVKIRTTFSNFFQPMGPILHVKNIALTSNPVSDKRIESVVYDDMLANEAVDSLYSKDIPVSRISRVLSAGLLGRKRKLVPTRWSITATDDMVSKSILNQIKQYQTIDNFIVFETTAFGNHYMVLLFPDSFCFEILEAWFKGSLWAGETTVVGDHEFFSGRKDYASNVTGSYYAGRLAVAEYLQKIRRQAGCIIFREVYSSYILPLGVWQVRENMRNALSKEPKSFDSKQSAMQYIWSRLNIPADSWLHASKILDFLTRQRKLDYFIKS